MSVAAKQEQRYTKPSVCGIDEPTQVQLFPTYTLTGRL